jgi:hypothetical protein
MTSEIPATHTNSTPADVFSSPVFVWKICYFSETARGGIFQRETFVTKLEKTRLSSYSLIFRFSRRFGRVHVLVSSLMSLVPGSYGHFKKWFENTKNQVWNSKCLSSFKEGKIFLKCNFCHFESAITPNGIYWNVGTFTRHLRDSPDCNNNITVLPMDFSDTLTVSLTLTYRIPNIYCFTSR